MADRDLDIIRIIADVLERVLETEVVVNRDDFWTEHAKELIEELEIEGFILE